MEDEGLPQTKPLQNTQLAFSAASRHMHFDGSKDRKGNKHMKDGSSGEERSSEAKTTEKGSDEVGCVQMQVQTQQPKSGSSTSISIVENEKCSSPSKEKKRKRKHKKKKKKKSAEDVPPAKRVKQL
jgi:hypothetical protein